jgi:type VI secretion system secreted protein Hcp
MAQVDYFLKVGGVPGESTDDKHKDEIDVLSWSWGVQQSGTMAHGGGGGEGKASFNDFNFTHHIDKASPVLLKACATGEHIKEATITVRKAGERQEDFLKVTFSDILVSSYRDDGGQGGVSSNTSLSYQKVVERVGEPTSIDIEPSAAGTAQLDVRSGAIEVLPCPEGQCALIAGFYQQFLARGLAEFEIKDLLPLIGSQFIDGRLSLQCTPLQQPPTDVIGVPALAVDSNLSSDLRSETAGVFDVLVYQPADLEITPGDYRGRAKKVGTIAVGPGVPAGPLTVDLSEMVGTGDGTLGIRIQLHGADELMEEEGATQTPPNPVVAAFMVVLTFESN